MCLLFRQLSMGTTNTNSVFHPVRRRRVNTLSPNNEDVVILYLQRKAVPVRCTLHDMKLLFKLKFQFKTALIRTFTQFLERLRKVSSGAPKRWTQRHSSSDSPVHWVLVFHLHCFQPLSLLSSAAFLSRRTQISFLKRHSTPPAQHDAVREHSGAFSSYWARYLSPAQLWIKELRLKSKYWTGRQKRVQTHANVAFCLLDVLLANRYARRMNS